MNELVEVMTVEVEQDVLPDEGDGRYCKHCGEGGRYARGLCHRCWKDLALRASYAPMTYRQRARCRGVGLLSREPLMRSDHPTTHPPGTEGKVDVLCERARLGVKLWHPQDAPSDLS